MAKVYVTRLRDSNVNRVFASLDVLKRYLVKSGQVSSKLADWLDSQFINHSLVTVEVKGQVNYDLLINEAELITE